MAAVEVADEGTEPAETVVDEAETAAPAESEPAAEQAAPAPEPAAAPIERPDHVDDLTKIKGTDPYLVSQLNERGIFTYAQVVALTDDEVAELSEALGIPGRIDHYNWRYQASQLDE